MTTNKQIEIEKLAADAWKKRKRLESLSLANTSVSFEDGERLAIQTALATAELHEANQLLAVAITS